MISQDLHTRAAKLALAQYQYFSRLVLARAAFLLDSLSLAFLLLVFLSFLVVRADGLATAHEWALFLSHYVDASPGARAPVNRVLGCAMVLTTLLVAWTRMATAKLAWSALDGAARAELRRTQAEIRSRLDPASTL